jgi:hypothetical protein
MEKQPSDLRQVKNFNAIYNGAEFFTFSDNEEKKEQADRWFDLLLKNQKKTKLTESEFAEFTKLSNILLLEEF